VASPLRVLIVEDSPDDCELILRELRRGGFAPEHLRVDTSDELAAALRRQAWDVIIADYSMPRFSGTDALALVRDLGCDTPFIFVSGTIGEDTAVRAMRGGAQDYMIKGNIGRLVPAIERELREIEGRRARARAEDRLRKLSRAVEHSANLVIITDAEGTIEYVNGRVADVTGFSVEEVVGRKPSLWKSDKTGDEVYAAMWRTILAGRDWRGEFENRRKDGSAVIVSCTISPIKDETGRITHFVGIQEDITERNALEEQLRRSHRMDALGQLTGGLAHDFNNLLTVVIGNLDQLLSEPATSAPVRAAAERALKASLRGAELTHNLLAFARRQSLAAKVFDLNELVASTTELLHRTLGEHIEIRTVRADNLWPALADPSQVESALTNLAINARDAMPNGGRLTIETANKTLDERYAAEAGDAAPGEYVMLAVSDTGSGIPPEVLGRVFEPFFTTKAHGKGTGLGLSMIYGFAKQSGGHVRIYSEPGHGTTVHLYLPRARAPAPDEAQNADAGDGVPAAGTTILVVEDNPDVRGLAVSMLESLGYRVLAAEDAEQALGLLRCEPGIALLFTDIVMPGGKTGVELAQEARAMRPELKVLLTSGFSEAALVASVPEGAVAERLSKPYRKAELARTIRRTLRGNGG
jgi:two-component system cell cycle sensor histidine kinase/response regulator CckA